jgi:hypothetical protein
MSDETHWVSFNKGRDRLEMKFEGDDYETATVKMTLEGKMAFGIPLEEPVIIPVRCLFALGYLALMSIRRTAAQYEKEAQEMIDAIELKKHPFKHVGGTDEKDKKATTKNK